ncbi:MULTISPECIES: DUF742 domain-containing protein [Kitasatospora]|uniref:DUF742 domain-containing protein n=2 Tax=Kitasatospora TaxID=2063 RepID=A0ABT1IT79_9ACTN|nr:DUF742 domain-containing protein [Kitasatospora paracochleata]MCP2308349.1 hypothetical protein [Kitasatospora paracochleata]
MESEDAWFDRDAGHLVRPYAITGGRTASGRTDFSLITLVVTADPDRDTSRMAPEPATILGLCRDRPLAVAEIAAQLDLPVSVVKVLLGDLADASLVLTRAPVPLAEAPDLALVQAVIDGVRRL